MQALYRVKSKTLKTGGHFHPGKELVPNFTFADCIYCLFTARHTSWASFFEVFAWFLFCFVFAGTGSHSVAGLARKSM